MLSFIKTLFMKKTAFPMLLLLTSIVSSAQPQFLIHGKIDLLTKSKSVRLSGYEPVPIRPDGSFEIKGIVGQPSVALISTDSSGASAIWLEQGEYTIVCKEVTLPNYRSVLFRSPELKGPANAELYNDFQSQQFSGFGITSQQGADQAIKVKRKERAVRYMDSILKLTNTSPVLPDMVRMVQSYVGDDSTRMFIQKLAPELRNSVDITRIEDGFRRQDKVKAERVFENFTLKDVADSNFSFTTLAGKKAILVDFWASDCGACRMDHPQLKQWYRKYADKGLQIVSISIDDDKAAWLKAVHDDGIGDWINVCDPHGFKASLMQDYYISFIPFRFLLDGNKNIVLINNMVDTWITEKDVAAMLDAQASSNK